RAAFSTQIAPDSLSYWVTPQTLFARVPGNLPVRTPTYSFIIAGVQLVGGSGTALLIVQFALRALGAALIAWQLADVSLLAGAAVGGLLALDPVSGATSASYLSESLYTSAHVLALALAIWQLRVRTFQPAWQPYAAGLAFGLAFLVRP